MKQTTVILFAFSCLAISSCGSSKNAAKQNGYYQPAPGYYQQVQQGVYQNQQPSYQQQYKIDNTPDVEGYVEIKKSPIEELALAIGTGEIRAFGSAESANEQMAFNAARAQATAALQEKIEVYVRAGLDQYVQETGVNGEYSIDESTRNQITTAVKSVVSGASILDSRKMYNPNTRRYKYEVCIVYNRKGILEAMQMQSERINKNEKQFEADMMHAWDALDAQNHKQAYGE